MKKYTRKTGGFKQIYNAFFPKKKSPIDMRNSFSDSPSPIKTRKLGFNIFGKKKEPKILDLNNEEDVKNYYKPSPKKSRGFLGRLFGRTRKEPQQLTVEQIENMAKTNNASPKYASNLLTKRDMNMLYGNSYNSNSNSRSRSRRSSISSPPSF